MNILAISHEFPPVGGGGANACYFLTQEFNKLGHSVQIVTVNYQGLQELADIDGVIVHRVNSARKNKEHCSFMEMLNFLVKALPIAKQLYKEQAFDICLIFFGIPSGPLGYVLKKKYKLPYIIRFGGGDIPGFQERFIKIYKLLGPAIKRIWKNADALIVNSQGLCQMAKDYYDVKEFQVICNGVDTNYFTPAKNCELDSIKLLFVSRLIKRKGLQYVIPQLQRIQKGSNKKVQMIVVGDGPYRDELEHITKENGVTEDIFFVGQKSREEILQFYQNADIFIFPSQKEGMPNVVLEAMACGLPVVMTPCQGAKELIDGNGYISSIGEFSNKVIELVNDDKKRKAMGGRSRERACKLFGWGRTASNYVDIMQNILQTL